MIKLTSQRPLNKYIECTLNNCGCRTNPLIWISKKHKIIFLEIAKCGSSSIKKALDIFPEEDDLINAYYWHKLNKNKPKILFTRGFIWKLFKRLFKLNFLKYVKNGKSNFDFSLGIKRGVYEFQPYFNDIEILLEKFPNFLYVANIRDPLKRFVSCFNMFSDENQPFRKRQRADVGQLVNLGIENFDFFIESSLKEPNHHFWPYSNFINKIKGVDNKLFINCELISKNWNLIKYKLNLPDLSSSEPTEYVNYSKSKLKISDLSEIQLEKIKNIYKDDLVTFRSIS